MRHGGQQQGPFHAGQICVPLHAVHVFQQRGGWRFRNVNMCEGVVTCLQNLQPPCTAISTPITHKTLAHDAGGNHPHDPQHMDETATDSIHNGAANGRLILSSSIA